MKSKAVVSVLCAAYNQEKYIKKMLDGLVMQETDFQVEYLIHDDASTDGTAQIIEEYARKYPDRIIPFLETENQFSRGNNFMFTQLLPAAGGKYLAFCEGDDYWTDPCKLQKQYDSMEAHPECSICVHQVQGVNENETRKIRTFPMENTDTELLSTEKIIHRLLHDQEWLFHTTSYFIRSEIIKRAVMEKTDFFMSSMYLDHGMMLLSAYAGRFYYLAECMSVYRMEADGGITNRNIDRSADVTRRRARSERGISSLEAFDKATNFAYHTDVQYFLDYMHFTIAECCGDYKYLLCKDMREHFRKLPARMRFRVTVSRYIPGFDRFYFWLRNKVRRI